MEELKLAGLLEADKELVLENIARDRTPEAAQAALEKELDRIFYRYAEECGSEQLSVAAQAVFQTARNLLPLTGAVSEVREWRRSVPMGKKERKLRPLGIVLAAAGLLTVLASMLALIKESAVGLTFALLAPPFAGTAAAFAGGVLLLRRKPESLPEPEAKQEYLVDGNGIYHSLRGALLVADRSLQELRDTEKSSRGQTLVPGETLTGAETELFASLLESAYARRGSPEAEELIGNVRYYLHSRGVELTDYSRERDAWFERLPARRPGTMRPALSCGGRLLKKGLASAAEE